MLNKSGLWRSCRVSFFAFFLVFPAIVAVAGDKSDANEGRVVSGMSIVGNDETPKELYIVPWKSHEAGKDVSFSSSVLNEKLSPVDKADFIRRLDFNRSGKSN